MLGEILGFGAVVLIIAFIGYKVNEARKARTNTGGSGGGNNPGDPRVHKK